MRFLPLEEGTEVPADDSNGFHNAGSDPAGSTIPFAPQLLADPLAGASSDHSDVDMRDVLVTTSFSMSASELHRMPRPWVLPAALLAAAVALEETTSVPGCWEPHGRPGTNSLISRTDGAAFPTLQSTNLSLHQ